MCTCVQRCKQGSRGTHTDSHTHKSSCRTQLNRALPCTALAIWSCTEILEPLTIKADRIASTGSYKEIISWVVTSAYKQLYSTVIWQWCNEFVYVCAEKWDTQVLYTENTPHDPRLWKNQSLSSVTREHFHLLLHFHRHSVMACQHQRLYLYSRWWCNLSLSTINQLSFENTTFSFRLWKDERIMFFIKKKHLVSRRASFRDAN